MRPRFVPLAGCLGSRSSSCNALVVLCLPVVSSCPGRYPVVQLRRVFPHPVSGASPPPHFAVPPAGLRGPLGCLLLSRCVVFPVAPAPPGRIELCLRCVRGVSCCVCVTLLVTIVFVDVLFVVGSFQSVSWKYDF